MSVFCFELRRVLRPVRMLPVLIVLACAFCFFMPQLVWNDDVRLAADASALIASCYGTHLEPEERAVIDDELFAQMKENIRLQMASCEVFDNANVKTYEEYTFLRYRKEILSTMTQEEKQLYSDESFLLNYGVGKDYDATLSDAERILLTLSQEATGQVGEILYQCLVLQRMEDWVEFWYDGRERLASDVDSALDTQKAKALDRYMNSDDYFGNMPNEVSEAVGNGMRCVAVALLFSVMLLSSVSPATDAISRTDILQAVSKKGKRLLRVQYASVVFVGACLSFFGIGAAYVFLHAKIPAVLWECPVNSYQSFFTVYFIDVSLEEYFLLLSLALVLLVLAVGLLSFAVSLLVKNYTALLGFLLPLSVASQWIGNLVFRMPFACRQSLLGPLYLTDLISVPMAELVVCVAVFLIGLTVSLLAVHKRKKEFTAYL